MPNTNTDLHLDLTIDGESSLPSRATAEDFAILTATFDYLPGIEDAAAEAQRRIANGETEFTIDLSEETATIKIEIRPI